MVGLVSFIDDFMYVHPLMRMAHMALMVCFILGTAPSAVFTHNLYFVMKRSFATKYLVLRSGLGLVYFLLGVLCILEELAVPGEKVRPRYDHIIREEGCRLQPFAC